MTNLRPDEQQWLVENSNANSHAMLSTCSEYQCGCHKAVPALCQRISELSEALRERRQICPICPAGKPCGLCRKADKLLEGRAFENMSDSRYQFQPCDDPAEQLAVRFLSYGGLATVSLFDNTIIERWTKEEIIGTIRQFFPKRKARRGKTKRPSREVGG